VLKFTFDQILIQWLILMESYELSKVENGVCVEDPFTQIQSHIVMGSTLSLLIRLLWYVEHLSSWLLGKFCNSSVSNEMM